MHTFSVILVYRGAAECDRDVLVYLLEAKDKAEALAKMNEWIKTDKDQPIEMKITEYHCVGSYGPTFIGMTTLLMSVTG